jgi:hypothetical protein
MADTDDKEGRRSHALETAARILRIVWWGTVIAATSILAFIGIRKIITAIVGDPRTVTGFRPIPGDPTSIIIEDPEQGDRKVKLPDKMVSKEVVAAGYSEAGQVVVRRKHDATNRRNIDSADSRSGGS